MLYRMYRNRNLVTDVFCNNGDFRKDEKDYQDILKLQGKINETLVVGCEESQAAQIAKNEFMLKLLSAKDTNVIATRDILSKIGTEQFQHLRVELLRDRFREFLLDDEYDFKRMYVILKILQDNNIGELDRLKNMRMEDGKITFECLGMTLNIQYISASDNICGNLAINVGGSSKTYICAEIELDDFPDRIDTGVRVYNRIKGVRHDSSACYFPDRPLKSEYVTEEFVNELVESSPYRRVLHEDVMKVKHCNDLRYICEEEVLSCWRRTKTDSNRDYSMYIGNEDSLEDCIGKYATPVCIVSGESLRRFVENRDKEGYRDYKLIWDDESKTKGW